MLRYAKKIESRQAGHATIIGKPIASFEIKAYWHADALSCPRIFSLWNAQMKSRRAASQDVSLFRKHRRLKAMAALGMALCLASTAFGQQLVLRDTPNLTMLRKGSAHHTVKAVDGSLLIRGEFDYFDGIQVNGLVRLSPQGNVDPAWQPADPGSVTAIAGSATGDVFIATTTAASERRLRKLTASGALVPGWEITPNGEISTMEMDAQGRLLVAGGFTMIAGQSRGGFAVLDPDTGLVGPAEPSLPDGYVGRLRRAPDGTIHLVLQQTGSAELLRLGPDGTLDPDWSVTVDGSVSDLAIASNGDAFLITSVPVDWRVKTRLVKVLAQSGTVDATWDPTAGWTPNSGSIYSIDVDASGSVFVTGTFDEIAGAPRPGFAKLQGQGAGANDPDWQPPAWLNESSPALVSNAIVHANRLQIVGDFVVTDLQPRPISAARLDLHSGELVNAQQAARAGIVTAQLRQRKGGTIVAGDFLQIDGEPRSHLARLTDDWQLDPAWHLPLVGDVRTLAEDASGRVLIGGAFHVQGQPGLRNLIRVDGAGAGNVDPTWLPDPDGQVNDLAIGSDGQVYLAGYLQALGGESRGSLARLHPNTGVADPAWTPMVSANVSALLLDDNGLLYASHSTSGGGIRVWRYPIHGSGQADPTWSTASGWTSARRMKLDSNGTLLVSGAYPASAFSTVGHLAAYPSTGTGSIQPVWEHSLGSRPPTSSSHRRASSTPRDGSAGIVAP